MKTVFPSPFCCWVCSNLWSAFRKCILKCLSVNISRAHLHLLFPNPLYISWMLWNADPLWKVNLKEPQEQKTWSWQNILRRNQKAKFYLIFQEFLQRGKVSETAIVMLCFHLTFSVDRWLLAEFVEFHCLLIVAIPMYTSSYRLNKKIEYLIWNVCVFVCFSFYPYENGKLLLIHFDESLS